ncbi:MAG: toxic anion resistance protein [Gemmiger sp.]|nr:toxic anion resistance protein [Gemmiger sp.]
MADQNIAEMDLNNIPAAPSLTLDTAPATTPSLTLDPTADEAVTAEVAKAEPVQVEDTPLTPEEQKMVNDCAEKIDINNSQMILQYGAASQKKLSDFSDTALSRVKTKDMGETGELITSLIGELKGFDTAEEQKGFFGFFKKQQASIENLKTRYDSADKNVERIKAQLEDHQVTLMKDITMLDKMYQLNLVYFKELTMYILAGKKKLAETRATQLKAAQEKAQKSQLPEDAQAARDLSDMCDRFEKKLYDLELTRNVSIQMGPQIRLIQSNDTMMAEKIQTTIVNTIPLWKNQMVLALGMAHSQQAMQAERAVTDATNDLLRKNAATLKQGTLDIARESERGVVDIETLQQTNQELISTLDELNKIRAEGKAKRAAAEQELGRIEGQLRAKLMEQPK